MISETLRIAIPKLFLWSEPGRIQEYAEAMSRAEAGRTYTRIEVERELFDIVPTMKFQHGAPRGRRTDGIVNAYGLERSGSRYRINGLNLLTRTGSGLAPTAEGLELGQRFRGAPGGTGWARALARQIAKREPRTRLVLGLLLQGHVLDVTLAAAVPTGGLGLVAPGGERTVISQRGCARFNDLLQLHADMALGPAWRADLAAIGQTGRVEWHGVQSVAPSTNDLPTALKKALAVFFYIGAFTGNADGWVLDAPSLRHALEVDNLADFGFLVQEEVLELTDDEAFRLAHEASIDGEGFVIVSQLAERFGASLGVPPSDREAALDSFVRNAMYHEKLKILDRHAGQPRMGRGLFGESESRRVRIDFHAEIVAHAEGTANRTLSVPHIQNSESIHENF